LLRPHVLLKRRDYRITDAIVGLDRASIPNLGALGAADLAQLGNQFSNNSKFLKKA
jgi:hypothetical protein